MMRVWKRNKNPSPLLFFGKTYGMTSSVNLAGSCTLKVLGLVHDTTSSKPFVAASLSIAWSFDGKRQDDEFADDASDLVVFLTVRPTLACII